MSRRQHPIEAESYRRLRAAVDLSALPPCIRAVTERVIHASADVDYADDLVCDEAELADACDALAAGAPLVCDAAMVAAGITSRTARCALAEPGAGARAEDEGSTRSAAGMRLAVEAVGAGAVYVVGSAPTALFAVLDVAVEPALVIGMPVGFVDAIESKAALRASGLPSVSNRSRKGGSAVAAAACNALLYLAEEEQP